MLLADDVLAVVEKRRTVSEVDQRKGMLSREAGRF